MPRRFEGGRKLSGGNGSASRWPALICAMPSCWCWTNPRPPWTPKGAGSFRTPSRNSPRERWRLLISHRFSTVRMADRIVVLEGGRLVEEGTHPPVMRLAGATPSMFEMQAASYR